MQPLHQLPPEGDRRWPEPEHGIQRGSIDPRDIDRDDDVADDGPDAPRKKARPGSPVEPTRVLRTLRRGRWWILGAATLGVVVGVAVAKLAIRHQYQSSASLRFEGVASLEGEDQQDFMGAQRDLPSRVESLRREVVLREVRARMGMGEVPIVAMQAMFENTADAESGLVTITGSSDSPERAARFTNTIVEVFVQHERERRRVDIETALGALDGRISAAQGELQLARARYDAFRQEHGVTDLTTEQEAGLAQATALRAEADLAVAEIASLEARVRELRAEVERTPRTQVTSATSESVDRTELARAQAHLQQIRGTLSSDHPRVQVAERQVRSLQQRVSSGGGARVTGAVSTGTSTAYETAQTALSTAQADLEAARRGSVELSRLADEAQQRVAGFSEIEGEASALLADVQVKQRLLSELSDNRARLQNMLETADPGFRMVARAVEPESAVASRRKLYVAAGVPLAAILIAILGLMGRELRGLRVHTASEVAWWGNGPVVGTTTWPRDPTAAGDLVADLDDSVPDARGTMLIVGATEKETPIATVLARQLSRDWTEAVVVEPAHAVDDPELNPALLAANAGPGVVAAPRDGKAGHAPPRRGRSARRAAGRKQGSALAHVGGRNAANGGLLQPQPVNGRQALIASAWEGALSGQQLRREARLADRVLVVVPSGAIAATQLSEVGNRLGREDGVGYVVVGIADEYASLPDRAGPIDRFWAATKSKE